MSKLNTNIMTVHSLVKELNLALPFEVVFCGKRTEFGDWEVLRRWQKSDGTFGYRRVLAAPTATQLVELLDQVLELIKSAVAEGGDNNGTV